MTGQHLESKHNATKDVFKHDSEEEIIGLDISEEAADKLEVECGYCGKLIRIRSLADHILVSHSTSIEKSRCTW
jgi:hypothetical protein